eukprot:483697-Pelagomonas_calceolata.AAC.1
MEQPYLKQVSVQAVHDFLLQHNNKLYLFISELVDIMLTGKDQSQADQPNNLAEGLPCKSKSKAPQKGSAKHLKSTSAAGFPFLCPV